MRVGECEREGVLRCERVCVRGVSVRGDIRRYVRVSEDVCGGSSP